MNRRHFLSTSVAAGVSTNHSQARNGPKDLRQAMFMGIAKAKKDLPRKAQLKIEGDKLRILQFTDIHFFCDREKFGETRFSFQGGGDCQAWEQRVRPGPVLVQNVLV